MQVRALVYAYLEVKKLGHDPKPEVMIPLVATQRELLHLRETLEAEIKRAFKGTGVDVEFPIGTMIETPRAAITASRLGIYADFFSFGTNDLTQLTWAFSRDDVESTFLPLYLDLELLPFNPFESLDQDGVGLLVKTAPDQARDEAMVLLKRFDLADKADQYPDRLSGGQQQRVAIIRSLAVNPRVLLLDEITSALDPVLVNEVLSIVRDLKHDGMTMVLATHEMGFATQVADEVCFLESGLILERGSPEQVLKNPQNAKTKDFLKRVHEAGRL